MKATFAASPSPADRMKMFKRSYSIFVRNSNEIFDLRRFCFSLPVENVTGRATPRRAEKWRGEPNRQEARSTAAVTPQLSGCSR
jgi:hypothetical protein